MAKRKDNSDLHSIKLETGIVYQTEKAVLITSDIKYHPWIYYTFGTISSSNAEITIS